MNRGEVDQVVMVLLLDLVVGILDLMAWLVVRGELAVRGFLHHL